MAMSGCCTRKMIRSLIVGNQFISRALKLSSTAHLQASFFGPTSSLYKHFSSSPVFLTTKDTNSLYLATETRKKRRMFESDDALTHQLSNFTIAEELLEFIESVPSKDFHERAIEVTVNNLFYAVKDIQSPEKKKEILRSVGNQKLSRIIKAHARSMDAYLLTTILKYFTVLDTPASHPTPQIVLRLLTKQANFLTLSQITYIYFLLERFHPDSRSSLSEAFMLALPVVFESQLDLQLGGLKSTELVACLRYASTTKLSNTSVEKIIKAILEKQQYLDLYCARTIIHSLADNPTFVQGSDELLPRVFEILTKNIHSIDSIHVSEIMGKCTKRFHGNPHFYNEDFVEAACNKFLECNEEFIVNNIKYVSTLKHVNIDLLEATADIIQKNPSIILNNDYNFWNVMRAFSNAGYKPENWNRIKMMLLDHPSLTKINVAQDIPLAVDYLSLDALPAVLVDKIFSPSYFPRVDSWYEKSGPFSLLMIANAVLRLYPEYQGNMPSSSMVQKWEDKTKRIAKNKQYPLQGALEVGLGAPSNVASCVFFNGILIDHCVLLDQHGSPIPFQEPKPQHLDDIYVPEGCKLVLFKVFQSDCYSSNTSRLRGIHALCSKVLKSLGFLVEIKLKSWNFLQDHEKIPYLLQKVKEQAEKSRD